MMEALLTSTLYRKKPLKDYKSVSGSSSFFQYGGSKITGWRTSQEDRIVCLPKFHEDMSFFGVYDGHGGEEVVEFLKRYLHVFIKDALEDCSDIELALYLGFLQCDFALENMCEEELLPIKDAITRIIRIPENDSAVDSPGSAGTSKEDSSMEQQELAAVIGTEIHKYVLENPSIVKEAIASSKTIQDLFYANLDEDDDEDEDYVIEEENIDETADSGSSSNCSDDNLDETEERKDQCQAPIAADTAEDKSRSVEKCLTIDDEIVQEKKPVVGNTCGSTATVVLLHHKKIYIANVGDSRCVACVKGNAIDLSQDHHPLLSEECTRIKNAGYAIIDDRINGGLNISRAFGDFGLKIKGSQDPFQAVIPHPYVTVLDITDDLEFVVIASDGIWTAWTSQDVIAFIKEQPNTMELHDVCAELFENLVDDSSDGTGCDNMSAIIINFRYSKSEYHAEEECLYNYPPKSIEYEEAEASPNSAPQSIINYTAKEEKKKDVTDNQHTVEHLRGEESKISTAAINSNMNNIEVKTPPKSIEYEAEASPNSAPQTINYTAKEEKKKDVTDNQHTVEYLREESKNSTAAFNSNMNDIDVKTQYPPKANKNSAKEAVNSNNSNYRKDKTLSQEKNSCVTHFENSNEPTEDETSSTTRYNISEQTFKNLVEPIEETHVKIRPQEKNPIHNENLYGTRELKNCASQSSILQAKEGSGNHSDDEIAIENIVVPNEKILIRSPSPCSSCQMYHNSFQHIVNTFVDLQEHFTCTGLALHAVNHNYEVALNKLNSLGKAIEEVKYSSPESYFEICKFRSTYFNKRGSLRCSSIVNHSIPGLHMQASGSTISCSPSSTLKVNENVGYENQKHPREEVYPRRKKFKHGDMCSPETSAEPNKDLPDNEEKN